MEIKITFDQADIDRLIHALQAKNQIRWEAIVKKNVTQLLNSARNGGTPVDTGELRISSSTYGDEMGYTKDYAPHVEYGHRIVRNGIQIGYVEGQFYLKKNVDAQRFVFYNDLLNAMKKG